ncbi:1-hydroxy-2-methyl-2-(E)-butenyl 4-diphosphate synthase [Photobacterium aphoticum]|uniref:1-hydroxy-2-methyl-2-(E)-butenyl 4-diphosphate synthase n=1 Tax=Photobacterium aphoticum TaxID=754436 RepID=A0A090R001_9GAMM|nr:1-hydroxy-2-methyl-2-(E)-butenyl 4-diphosphate synthase [Photobacterium aphoticum]
MIGTVNELEQRLEDITLPMDVSVIGCVVNGPGEAEVSHLVSPVVTVRVLSTKTVSVRKSALITTT